MLDEILIEIVLSKMVKDCRGPSVLGNDDIPLLSFLEVFRQIVLDVLDARQFHGISLPVISSHKYSYLL
jgi:hypothetical protein